MIPDLASIAAVGFGFRERMSGRFHAATRDPREGDLAFDFEVRCEDLAARLVDIVGSMSGRVTMTGLAESAPANGTIAISLLLERRIRYSFSFTGNDGRDYEFHGTKRLSFLRPIHGWTTLEGTVLDGSSGDTIADAVLRFDLRSDLLRLLASFRPLFGRSRER